jgi:hypothetical protein
MLSIFSRDVQITEEGRLIEITGIPAYLIDRDIAKIWGTRKLQIHMFVQMTRRKIVIPTFFAVDFVYMLEEMAKYPGNLYSDRQVIKRTVEVIRANTWLANIDKEFPSIFDYSKLKELNISLIDHQRRFMAWYDQVKLRYNLRGILLTAAPGGGKTIAGLATAICRKSDVTFIICPKNAINRVWEAEIVTRFKEKQSYWISSEDKEIPKDVRWLIFHYEDLDKATKLISKFNNKNLTLILDESHNFNDTESLRTQLFLSLCANKCISDIIFASGTPIKAMGSDSIPLLRAIDPLFTANAEMRFKKIFGKDAKKANDILANRLGIISYKVPKSEFMPNEPIYEEMKLSIPDGEYYTLDRIRERMSNFIHDRVDYYQKRRKNDMEFYQYCMELYEEQITKDSGEWKEYMLYKGYINTFITRGFDPGTMSEWSIYCNKFEKENILPKLPQEHRKDFKDVKSAVKYPELKIRGEALGRILGRERIEANIKLAKAVNYQTIIAGSKKKVICFSSHVDVIDAITELQKKELKLKPLKVTAETSNELKTIVSMFEKNVQYNPLNATYQSLSTAVPLVMANTLIMLNHPFRIHEMEQAVARAWRIGQDTQVVVFLVQLDTGDVPNISSRSADIMNWSKEQVDQIMGYQSDMDIDISIEGLTQENAIDHIEDQMEYLNDLDNISIESRNDLVNKYRNYLIGV